MIIFLFPAHRRYGTRAGWRPSRARIKEIVRLGWPGGLMMTNEMICWGYLMTHLLALSAKAADQDPVIHNAAGWIALRYMHVAFMPAVGLSIAVTAMVGRCMGMGRPDLAARRAWLGLAVTLAYMGLCGLVFVVFREWLITRFVPEGMSPEKVAELLRVGAGVMIIAAFFQLFDATAIIMSSALRGAGDTVWPGVVASILAWVCIIGLGHLMIILAPGLASWGPWIGGAAYLITTGLALLGRFLGGKWRSIRLVEEEEPPAAGALAEPKDDLHIAETVAAAAPGSA
jgi:MATE family multidrug resistance protein